MRAPIRWFIVAAAIALTAACGQKGGPASAGGEPVEMAMGNSNAKVTVTEFASVTCPHCARFNEEVFPAFKAKYVDTGLVLYKFHEFLTPPESAAAAGFRVARCAGKDKYFAVLDALFHSQNTLYQTQDPRAWVFTVGRSAGLSDDQITKCLQDEKGLDALKARMDQAVKDGVTGTPTFMVNGKKLDGQVLAGKKYDGGEITLEQLDAALQPLVKR